jgi:hypothetical protein
VAAAGKADRWVGITLEDDSQQVKCNLKLSPLEIL